MRGQFIVLEGTDGSGKGTQFELLYKRLVSEGYKIEKFDFPRYSQPSSYFVGQYLNGKYGSLDEIGPRRGSLFYALDRFQASFDIRKALQAGKIVLANRYVASNMGHQGAKLTSAKERSDYFRWLDDLEYKILGIPRPDFNIVLHMPAHIAWRLVDKKSTRDYLRGAKRDLHEADLGHLKKAEEVYLQMCKLFPDNFVLIACTQNGSLLSRKAIAGQIWEKIAPILNKRLVRQKISKTTKKGKINAR